jgi:hypothetical protein
MVAMENSFLRISPAVASTLDVFRQNKNSTSVSLISYHKQRKFSEYKNNVAPFLLLFGFSELPFIQLDNNNQVTEFSDPGSAAETFTSKVVTRISSMVCITSACWLHLTTNSHAFLMYQDQN